MKFTTSRSELGEMHFKSVANHCFIRLKLNYVFQRNMLFWLISLDTNDIVKNESISIQTYPNQLFHIIDCCSYFARI